MRWQQTPLGEHCEILSGYPFKSDGFTDEPNDVHLVKGENVGQGEVLWEISKRWPRSDAEDLSRFALKPGDLVLAMDRPWVPAGLKFARIPDSVPDSLVVQRVARLRARGDLNQNFLKHVIASPEFTAYIQNIGRGVGVPHISGKEIGAYTLALPPIQIQEDIASILSTYDNLIENNRRRMKLLEEAARQVYQEWFVRLRFPGYEHTRIVDGVPEGWERMPLESALVLQRGFDLPSQDRLDGSVPIYASTGVNGRHNAAKAKAPGVVTGRSGSLGMVHYVYEDYWPLNTTLWVKEFRRVSPLFAFFLLSALRLDQYNGGVSVPTLDRKVVHKIEVVVPNNKIQALFGDYVMPMFTQLRNLSIYNDKLRTARDLLLPKLMSGEVVV